MSKKDPNEDLIPMPGGDYLLRTFQGSDYDITALGLLTDEIKERIRELKGAFMENDLWSFYIQCVTNDPSGVAEYEMKAFAKTDKVDIEDVKTLLATLGLTFKNINIHNRFDETIIPGYLVNK